MKHRVARSASVTFLLLAVACRAESVTGTLPLGDVVVSARETFYRNEAGEPIVRVGLATEQIYSSASDYIDASTDVDGRTITIFARRVVEPPIGVDALGPATYSVTVPVTDGAYTLRVKRWRGVDEYRLVVTTEALELQPIRRTFTRAAPARVWRYPRQSFVTACTITAFMSAGTLERCNEFRDSLLAVVPLERIEFGADGEIPYFTGIDRPGHLVRAEYYSYASEEDFASVGAVIRAFGERYPGISIWARNWRNEWHGSWAVPEVP